MCPHCGHVLEAHDERAGCLYGWRLRFEGCWCMGDEYETPTETTLTGDQT